MPKTKAKIGGCELCGRWGDLQTHHVFGGTARQMSDEYGATVNICFDCHRDIHMNPKKYKWLKEKTQRELMARYEWNMDDWMCVFMKNYLEEDDGYDSILFK